MDVPSSSGYFGMMINPEGMEYTGQGAGRDQTS